MHAAKALPPSQSALAARAAPHAVPPTSAVGRLKPVRFVGDLVPPLAARPGPLNFAAGIWPYLSEAADGLAPSKRRIDLPARDGVSSTLRPAIAWVERTAISLGIPSLRISRTRGPAKKFVTSVGGAQPELVLDGQALDVIDAGPDEFLDAVLRFEVGQALGRLREHAVSFEEFADDNLQAIFQAAAVLTGHSSSTTGGSASPARDAESRARALAKALSRKDRKALVQSIEGTGFDPIDARAFRAGVLQMADRIGLAVCGDLGVAVHFLVNGRPPTGADVVEMDVNAVAGSVRAMNLIRFALGDEYLTAARDLDAPTPMGIDAGTMEF